MFLVGSRIAFVKLLLFLLPFVAAVAAVVIVGWNESSSSLTFSSFDIATSNLFSCPNSSPAAKATAGPSLETPPTTTPLAAALSFLTENTEANQ